MPLNYFFKINISFKGKTVICLFWNNFSFVYLLLVVSYKYKISCWNTFFFFRSKRSEFTGSMKSNLSICSLTHFRCSIYFCTQLANPTYSSNLKAALKMPFDFVPQCYSMLIYNAFSRVYCFREIIFQRETKTNSSKEIYYVKILILNTSVGFGIFVNNLILLKRALLIRKKLS